MAKKTAAADSATADDLRKQAADLVAQADAAELEAAEAAKQEAIDNETPEQTVARELAEAEAVKVAAAVEAQRKLVEDPTDEQKAGTIGVDHGGSGDYTYYPVPEPVKDNYRAPRLLFNGANIEHVADDRFGRWLYRRM